MIITLTTVVLLAIGVLSLLLAFYGGVVSTEVTHDTSGNPEAAHRSEQKYYLLSAIGLVVLLARVASVPLFFWMLQSLVPFCPGAMCAYGVINVATPYSVIGLALKVTLPFAYGLWIVIENANRRHPLLPLSATLSRAFLWVLLPMVLIDSAVDIFLVAAVRPIYAPCCSSVYDVQPPFSPSAFLGTNVGIIIMALTIVLSLLIIVGQVLGDRFRFHPVVSVILSSATAVLYVFMLHDVYAPMVLGLPSHHCPFCLFQEYPDTALFTGFFWLGIASAIWCAVLARLWTIMSLPAENIAGILRSLRRLSSVMLLFSMVSVVSHLLVLV